MANILLFASAVILFVSVQACTDSYHCGAGHCCVDSNNQVISSQLHGGFGGPISIGGPQNGTCVKMQAQKGQMCDSTCQCAAGLKCYRPMSGVCCPPMLCYDATYVNQQQHYWSNCLKTPGCALPPCVFKNKNDYIN